MYQLSCFKAALGLALVVYTHCLLVPRMDMSSVALPLPFIIPIIYTYNPNSMFRVFNEINDNIREVNSFNEVVPSDLMRYGVVRIASTKSLIINKEMAANVMDETYKPDIGSSIQSKAQMKSHEFYELSFEDAQYEEDDGEWTTLGPCHENRASGAATYSQGWTVGVTTDFGVDASLNLGFITTPGAKAGFSLERTTAGSLSCEVPINGTLQFQIKVGSVKVSHVKRRTIKVKNNYGYTAGIFAALDVGKFEKIEPYTVPNKKSIHTACVTNPQYLKCEANDSKFI